MTDQGHETQHHHPNYALIYVALVVLLAISVVGNFSGVIWVTLILAFGVALVKATLVARNFMHLKWEKVIAKWVLAISLALMALFFAGVAPDVMKDRGLQWVNNADLAAIARGIPDEEEPGQGWPPGTAAAQETKATQTASAAPAAAPAAAPFSPETTFKTVCSACHGPEGEGNGPGAAGLDPKPANFTDPAFWVGKTDAVLVKAIRQGGASVGKSAAMPAWGSILSEAQAKEMVAYLHTLKGK